MCSEERTAVILKPVASLLHLHHKGRPSVHPPVQNNYHPVDRSQSSVLLINSHCNMQCEILFSVKT